MGYNTTYRLEYKFLAHQDRFEETMLEEMEETEYVGELINNGLIDCKWYEHDDDMLRLSERYPMVVFTLSGEGEESGDIWKKYYCAGKVQIARAKITFDPFDKDKLE